MESLIYSSSQHSQADGDVEFLEMVLPSADNCTVICLKVQRTAENFIRQNVIIAQNEKNTICKNNV